MVWVDGTSRLAVSGGSSVPVFLANRGWEPPPTRSLIRGGHWTERRAEGMTDRQALKIRLYDVDRTPSNRIALYTCGSPLHSLYATFFPRYFDSHFFKSTRQMTCQGSRWRNYWRQTDPIGTPLPDIRERDNVDVTELADQETLGHSEY